MVDPEEPQHDSEPRLGLRLPRVVWFPLLAICLLIGIDLRADIFGPLDLLLFGTIFVAVVVTYVGSRE